MPVDKLYTSRDFIWGFWKILEDEGALSEMVPNEQVSPAIVNPSKRLEFLAGRVLIRSLLAQWQLGYNGLTKDEYGKPYLADSAIHLSLSHSFPYVAAVLHRHKNVGIDLEQPKDKLLRIAPRILAPAELENAGSDVVKHCIYWCAKETLVKVYGKKDLVFAKNLLINPFPLEAEGFIVGRIIANNSETTIPLRYIVKSNFVVVVSN